MVQRGRKSATSLEVVNHSGLSEIRRPDPAEELTDEQAHEWLSVVNRMPAEWFPRETHGLLVQYCRHVVAARRVAQLVEAEESAEEFSIKRYEFVLRIQEREGRAMSSLASRMRITQQSTVDHQKRKDQKIAAKPWE